MFVAFFFAPCSILQIVFQQQYGQSVKRPFPPSPLSLRSREKGQVDDAICGLWTSLKTASLCT